MPPKLSDGDRPIDGILNNPIAPADWDAFLDELKDVFKPQPFNIPLNLGFAQTDWSEGGQNWDHSPMADPPFIFNDTGVADVCLLPVQLRVGQCITIVQGMVSGVAGTTNNGSIKLRRFPRTETGNSADAGETIWTANRDFATGAVTTDTLFKETFDNPHKITDDYAYYFEILPPVGGGAAECRLYNLMVVCSMGDMTGSTTGTVTTV